MSAESELLDAILGHLRADADMQQVFGAQPRIFDDLGGANPLYPYLVVTRHEVTNVEAQNVKLLDHLIDLQVMTRWRGREGAREAVGLVRRLVDRPQLALPQHRLSWCHSVFSDTLMLKDLQTFKGIVRIKARTTPISNVT